MLTISINLIYISFVFYGILQIFSLIKLNKNLYHGKREMPIKFVLSFCLIFSVYAYCVPDFAGHALILKLLSESKESHIEPFYDWLGKFVNCDYLLFRIIIYSVIYYCLFVIMKKYSANKKIFVLFFIIWMLSSISNLIRSSLSDVIAFLGILAFYRNPGNVKNFLILLIFIIPSFYLHKSAFMLIVPLALSFLPLNKRKSLIYAILFPIITIAANFVMSYLFKTYFVNSSYSSMQEGINLTYIIRNVVVFCVNFMVWLFIIRKTTYLAHSRTLYGYIYRFLFFGLIIWSATTLLPISSYVGYRFFGHCLIPIVLLATYLASKSSFIVKSKLYMYSVCLVIINIINGYYSVYALSLHLEKEFWYIMK